MVTGEQVKEAVKARGLTWIPHHDCSLCRMEVGYVVQGDDLFFRSGCGCSWSPDRPCSWEEAAEHINRQQRSGQWGDVAARVAAKFGIELEPIA